VDFRPCRPFSFLYSTSATFINAQTNLTLMNSLIWGTCNTPLSNPQCRSNMASFASQLQSDCSQELGNQNLLVVNSLIALQAFQVMHDTGCLVDPTTNAYCYLSAVQNTNPSDLYFYSLPLGIPLPNTSKPSCSACSKSIMAIYATALQDVTQAKLLTGLKSSYDVSAQVAAQFCGSAFALTSISAAISLYYYSGWRTMFTSSIFAFTWTILTYVSWHYTITLFLTWTILAHDYTFHSPTFALFSKTRHSFSYSQHVIIILFYFFGNFFFIYIITITNFNSF